MYDDYTYNVTWSVQDQEYVGNVREFPVNSYLCAVEAATSRSLTCQG